MDEFALIANLFRPLARENAGALALMDDAALLVPPSGCDLVFTKDMMIADRHFFAEDAPDLIARKLLRVNLSDLAAMGAEPLGYLLGLAFAGRLDADLAGRFVTGLRQDQERYGIALYGGDTVSGAGRLALSLTAIGSVPHGTALLRSGARPGDIVWVSGTIGDAALGLRALKGEIGREMRLIDRYYLPEPRLALGKALRGIATAAADVSDGLIADLDHILEASGRAARIHADRVPLSAEAARAIGGRRERLLDALTGGDDYELVFTAPADRHDRLWAVASETGTPLAPIGEILPGRGLDLIGPDGTKWPVTRGGFMHE